MTEAQNTMLEEIYRITTNDIDTENLQYSPIIRGIKGIITSNTTATIDISHLYYNYKNITIDQIFIEFVYKYFGGADNAKSYTKSYDPLTGIITIYISSGYISYKDTQPIFNIGILDENSELLSFSDVQSSNYQISVNLGDAQLLDINNCVIEISNYWETASEGYKEITKSKDDSNNLYLYSSGYFYKNPKVTTVNVIILKEKDYTIS